MPGLLKKQFFTDSNRRSIYKGSLFVALLLVAIGGMLRLFLGNLPSIASLEDYTPSLTTRVYDVNNQIIAEFSIEKRALLLLNKIPVDMQNAVISTEDNRFFRHWGISPRGIMRALLRDILHRRAAQGGSTITQQLSKLIFLKPEKTISRKLKEILIALLIERSFSKQEILQMYLNQIYFGSGVYGVQSAAKLYFGKEVEEMTLSDCALLAGLIASPETYSPFNHPDKTIWRRSIVLSRMLSEGFITKEEMQQAEKEPLPTTRSYLTGTRAGYFVEYVRQILEPRYGINTLWKGGLNIYTTLDLQTQTTAEIIMEKNLKISEEESAKERERQAKLNPVDETDVATHTWRMQGAFMISDVKTGAIRALIGGRDYKESQFNRATQANRQPGSTFKPFTMLAALMNGYTPATIVDDNPVAYYYDGRDWRLLEGATDQTSIDLAIQPFVGNKDFKIWVPNDFDGKFLGKITLRKALELSRNLASVYIVDKIGPSAVVEVAKKAGIKRPLDAVPSIGLGTSIVPMLEMINAFSTFANGGIHVEPYAIIKVVDAQGKVLEEHVPQETEVFSPQYSYLILNMMRGVVENGTARYARKLKRPLVGKTGTTQDNKDLWFIGATPDTVAAAWMGYDDSASLGGKDLSGGATVVPWWTEIMTEVFKNQPARDFPVPEGISFIRIDAETGMLALPSCKKPMMEAFIRGTEPKVFCDVDHNRTGDSASLASPPSLTIPATSQTTH